MIVGRHTIYSLVGYDLQFRTVIFVGQIMVRNEPLREASLVSEENGHSGIV